VRRRYTVPKDERGRFPAKHAQGVDPELIGLKAFEHPAVKAWHEWLVEEWWPEFRIVLLTPCSNVKPYTRSPTSRKVKGVLRRLGLWDELHNKPWGVDWLYLSDLLVLVPYTRAEEYPACCYELHPEELLKSPKHYNVVVDLLARVLERQLATAVVIAFLPRNYLRILGDALTRAKRRPVVHTVRYNIFSTRELEETLRRVLEEERRVAERHAKRLTETSCGAEIIHSDGSRTAYDPSCDNDTPECRMAKSCAEIECRLNWLAADKLPELIRKLCRDLMRGRRRQATLDEFLNK